YLSGLQAWPVPHISSVRDNPISRPGSGLNVNLRPLKIVLVATRLSSSRPTMNSACQGPSQESQGGRKALVSSRSIPIWGIGRALFDNDRADIQPGPHQWVT